MRESESALILSMRSVPGVPMTMASADSASPSFIQASISPRRGLARSWRCAVLIMCWNSWARVRFITSATGSAGVAREACQVMFM